MKTKIYSTNLGNFQRRQLLGASAALIGSVFVRPLMAAPATLESVISEFSRGAKVIPAKVKFEIAELIDNGNAVPITVSVESPMTDANHVVAIAVFNEKNPQREVIKTKLTPLAGRAQISARIRLATSQKLTAIAEMNDGTFYAQTVEVVVTLAACIEE
jgi:sulfur-oxidizing protein SoxY